MGIIGYCLGGSIDRQVYLLENLAENTSFLMRVIERLGITANSDNSTHMVLFFFTFSTLKEEESFAGKVFYIFTTFYDI